jgi:AraC-like DNA-binding protein
VRPAQGIDAFLAAPAGRFVSGNNWIYYCVDGRFFGQIYWGSPQASDIERLVALWQVERRPTTPRHASLVDARRLQTVASDAFAVVARSVGDGQAALAGKVSRQALLRPSGMTGALVSGFYEQIRPRYPVQVFDDLDAALAWLGRPELAPVVSDLAERSHGEDAMVRALRQHLAGALRHATLPAAARALGVSERTLQRRLREAGTSFQDELQSARVRAAEELLLDPELKLTAIAADVGCASLQHFSGLFRRRTGVTPSQWRARRR